MITKHPLFWKEWRGAKWWSLLITTVFLTFLIAVNERLSSVKKAISAGQYEMYETIFSSVFINYLQTAALLIIPIIIVIAVLLFSDNRKGKVGEFIQALPYTKSQVFKVKWFVGAVSITIPFIIFTALSFIMRYVNWSWINNYYQEYSYGSQLIQYDNLNQIMLPIIQIYLFLLAFYSLIMLVQTLIGNNIIAAIIGVLTLLSPWFLLETANMTLGRVTKGEVFLDYYPIQVNILELMLVNYKTLEITLDKGDILNTSLVSFEYYGVKIIISLVLLILSYIIGMKAYSLNDMSKNGQLTMFKSVEVILILGVTVCSSLFVNNLLGGLNRTNNLAFELITLVIGGALGFIIINSINKVSKGGKL